MEQKRKEIHDNKTRVSLKALQEVCETCAKGRPFAAKLRKPGEVALLAEIKKASPSKGLIRPDFDPAVIAKTYSSAGASAISVLTDREFFQGSPEYLQVARSVSNLPLLRKEFIVDPYQIFEAKVLGADAILLIMAILSDAEVSDYIKIASSLGIECLIEVHTDTELKRALFLGAKIIGINNRDLRSFKTDLTTTFRLREMILDSMITVVSESGINTSEDVQRLRDYQVNAMLVGEALMRESDIARKIDELLGVRMDSSREDSL